MWKPEKILFDESDDEGLSYVYFDLGDFRYFALTFNPDEDDEIYLEFNEQTFSIESNNVAYTLNNRILSFDFGADIQEVLRIEKYIGINSFGKNLANIFSNGGKP